ncbi:MAG: NfeD family protein, partial [Chthoniobacteraceae bacterium]
AFLHYGSPGASVVLLVVLIGGTALLVWWLRYAPRSFLARKWSLHESVPNGPDPTSLNDLLHSHGETITSLRPSGVANVAGRRTDVVTRGEMIDAGQAIEVIEVEGRRVVVRPLPRYDGAD